MSASVKENVFRNALPNKTRFPVLNKRQFDSSDPKFIFLCFKEIRVFEEDGNQHSERNSITGTISFDMFHNVDQKVLATEKHFYC